MVLFLWVSFCGDFGAISAGCRVFDPSPFEMMKGFVLRFTLGLMVLVTGFPFCGDFMRVLSGCRVLYPSLLGLLGLTRFWGSLGPGCTTFSSFLGPKFTFWG